MVRPRRLGDFDYLGPNAYFVTACTFNRIRWFADDGCARGASAQLLRTSSDYGFDLLAYCFMPDHLHALVAGVRAEADFRKFTAMFKQRSAFDHAAKRKGRLWQEGYLEHIVRSDEKLEDIITYIVANPVRAGLCDGLGKYPYLGSSRYTLEQIQKMIQMNTGREPWRP